MADKYVIKADGSEQKFSKTKIAKGCRKAGAKPAVANKVANAVALKVKSGTTTRDIGLLVITQLRKYDREAAASFEDYFKGRK